MNWIETALKYHAAGLCVLPADPKLKYPVGLRWRRYQGQRPTEAELRWRFASAGAICMLTGAPSGEAEMLDFDHQGELFSRWADNVRVRAPGLLDRLVIERSPGKGYHVTYRCEVPICSCIKLAQRRVTAPNADELMLGGKAYKPQQDPRTGEFYVLLTLIETRGDGGLALCSPSPGYALLQGDLAALPILTETERDLLLEVAWELSEYTPVPEETLLPSAAGLAPGDVSATAVRPGDDFNQRGNVHAVLLKHGWTLARAGENEYWRRPGNAKGWSATLKDGVFFNHTTNAAPFQPKTAYSAFSVFALLEHGGDFSAAAVALRKEGFGSMQTTKLPQGVDLSRIAPDPLAAYPEAQMAAGPVEGILTPTPLFHFKTDEDPNNLLGRRWLCRGGSCLLVGQTGMGKSSFAMQAAITWALGEPLFGITPVRPLKSLYIQAENDVGDLAEMFQGVLRGINRIDRLQELQSRMVFVSDTVHSGKDFHPWVQGLIAKHKPDVVWIDPLFSFLKGSVSDQETVSTFLRPGLGGIAQDTGVTWIIVHHANKPLREPARKGKWTGTDYAYLGAGSAELANWARAVIVLREVEKNIVELRVAKRGKRAGLVDLLGIPATDIYLEYGKQGICWVRSPGPEDHRKKEEEDLADAVVEQMEIGQTYTRRELRELACEVLGVKKSAVLTPGRRASRVYAEVIARTAEPFQEPFTSPQAFTRRA